MSKKSKQDLAISLLAKGSLHKDVAKELDVTPQTISAWLREPSFVAAINTMKMDNLESSRDKLHALFATATSTIEDIMVNGDSDSVRLKAAQSVLDASGVQVPQTGLWGWAIGPQTAQGVEEQQQRGY